MKKTLAFVVACCAVASACWMPLQSAIADPQPTVSRHHHSNSCATACAACANSCSSCVQHCLEQVMAGKKEHARTLRLCADCADLCSLAAKVESRGGPLNLLICDACAKACGQCAEACLKFKDQEHMAECAKSCAACASACREMMHHAGHAK